MDAIALLKTDHRTVEDLFKRYEKLGEGGASQKRKIVAEIIRELSVHASIEETVFYPAVRKAMEEGEDQVLEALEEHHIVKWTLSELEKMEPTEERYDAKVKVLIESVRHHVKEEQDELFPEVRAAMDRKTLVALGQALELAKKGAPTRPHPRAPDEPPANTVVSIGAGLLDRAKELVESVTHRTRNARKEKQKESDRNGRAKASAKSEAKALSRKPARRVAKSATRSAHAS